MSNLTTSKSTTLAFQQGVADCLTAAGMLSVAARTAGLYATRQMMPDIMELPSGAASTVDFMARVRDGRLPMTFKLTSFNRDTDPEWAMSVIKWSDNSILIVNWSLPKDNRPLANGYVGKRVVVTWDGHERDLRVFRTQFKNVVIRPLKFYTTKIKLALGRRNGYPTNIQEATFGPLFLRFKPNLVLVGEVEVWGVLDDTFLITDEDGYVKSINGLAALNDPE